MQTRERPKERICRRENCCFSSVISVARGGRGSEPDANRGDRSAFKVFENPAVIWPM